MVNQEASKGFQGPELACAIAARSEADQLMSSWLAAGGFGEDRPAMGWSKWPTAAKVT